MNAYTSLLYYPSSCFVPVMTAFPQASCFARSRRPPTGRPINLSSHLKTVEHIYVSATRREHLQVSYRCLPFRARKCSLNCGKIVEL